MYPTADLFRASFADREPVRDAFGSAADYGAFFSSPGAAENAPNDAPLVSNSSGNPMGNVISSAVNWKFLGEPFWRWFVFLVAISFATAAWNGILSRMR